jgi:hypothetical protein
LKRPERRLHCKIMTRTFANILKRVLIGVAVAFAVAYAVDLASLRVRARHASATDPYETLVAPRVYAIAEKGNKTEYQIDEQNPQQSVKCVHALFPHDGLSTCWQVQRALHQTIPM